MRYEKRVEHWFLTVGDLKEIIKDIPNDHVVAFVSSETKHHITHVTSVGHLTCESEEHDALGFCCENHPIDKETGYTKEVYFSGLVKEEE